MRALLLCPILCGAPALAAPDTPRALEDQWIVTLAGVPAVEAAAAAKTWPHGLAPAPVESTAADLALRQQALLDDAGRALGRELAPRIALTRVANAVVLRLSPAEARRLEQLPGVAAVEPDRSLPLLDDVVPGFVGAAAVWAGGTLESRGEGVVVGVLDSGVAAAHRSFADPAPDGHDHVNPRGQRYGLCLQTPARCNDKLIGLYDFTSEGSRDGSDAVGHGTHVAAIAVGNPVPLTPQPATGGLALTISGVAPRAALISYKVCTRDASNPNSSGTCPFSAILAGIEQAARDRPDIVNYSIGGDPRDPWSGVRGAGAAATIEAAFLNLRALGVLPVAAAGNAGPGAGTVESAANAPWVLGVANTSHDRLFGTRLTGLAGPGVDAPFDLVGASLSGGLPRRPLVYAADFGNALCGTGASEGLNPTGASNPFAANTFSGQIVVCERGVYARVEKGYNVRAAGAGGYVLVNTAAEGESVVADAHFLPATHLGLRDGRRLVAAIAAARIAGGAIEAAIGAASRETDPALADRVNASSSRGPVRPYGGWAKPDLAAPGTAILSAVPGAADAVGVRTGTSMAAPAVTGAAALLRALRPQWSVDELASALVTTATPGGTVEDAVTPATPLDRGAGRLAVDRALRAGLGLRIGAEGFRAGDPQIHGAAAAAGMNLPGIVLPDCSARCGVQRRLRDLAGGGRWRVLPRLPSGVRALPSVDEFPLAAAGETGLAFEFFVEDARWLGRWVHGEIALVPDDPSLAEQRLPVSLYASAGQVPERLPIMAAATSGQQDFVLQGLAALPDARFDTTPLVAMAQERLSLPRDPTPLEPYDLPSPGVAVRWIEVAGSDAGTGVFELFAEARSDMARDVDLYLGLDSGDGIPQRAEQLCAANGPLPTERCRVEVALDGSGDRRRYWVLVQNHDGGTADGIDLEHAAVPREGPQAEGDGSLVASGPGRTAGEPFRLRAGWSLPDLAAGERRLGFIGIGAVREFPRAVASVLVDLRASPAVERSLAVLDPRGAPLRLRLDAGEAHARLVLDVPAGGGALEVESRALGDGGDVDLWLVPAARHGGDPPLPPAPPRESAIAAAATPGSDERIEVGAAAPGRYHIVAGNRGPAAQAFTLRARLSGGGAPPRLADNWYFNPQRDGHGLFVTRGGDQMAVFWYTFEADGTPVWYVAQARAPVAEDAVWSAPLWRSTWNGAANRLPAVGRVLLTRTGVDRFVYAWQLDGSWGAEPMEPLAAAACPEVGGQPVEYTGHWFAPSRPGYGFSVVAMDRIEAQVAYVYDQLGQPRWVLGLREPFGGSSFEMRQYRGFCPQCPRAPLAFRVAGTLVRDYFGPTQGHAALDLGFGGGIVGTWRSAHPIEMISTPLACTR